MIESHGERISVSGNRETYWGIVRFLSTELVAHIGKGMKSI
jgi:hypothetical protein